MHSLICCINMVTSYILIIIMRLKILIVNGLLNKKTVKHFCKIFVHLSQKCVIFINNNSSMSTSPQRQLMFYFKIKNMVDSKRKRILQRNESI